MKEPEVFAPAVIRLLQGILYYDDRYWRILANYELPIRDYFAQIGLRLYLDENGGFAYVYQPDEEDEDAPRVKLPRITQRRALTYPVTLLCVLLRERLDDFEAQNTIDSKCVISSDDVRDMLLAFAPDISDESRLLDNIERYIRQLVEFDFLKPIPNTMRFEIRPILKAKISVEVLQEIKDKLAKYVGTDDASD